METVSFRPLPIDQSDVQYEHGPDSQLRPGSRTEQTDEEL